MRRRPTTALVLAIAVLAATLSACRPDTVTLGFEPEDGATYWYRYELVLHLERALDGEAPTVTDLDTVITAKVTIVGTTSEGTRARLVIRRDGGDEQTLTVLIDRAGSLRGIEEVAGLPADAFGVGGLSSVLGMSVSPPPNEPVAIGDAWTVGGDVAGAVPATGEARLERLGVIDGEKIAEVASQLRQTIADDVAAGPSGSYLSGDLRSDTTTSYDLVDGAVRGSDATARGDVDVVIRPPAGSTALSVHGRITYELSVQTTRL